MTPDLELREATGSDLGAVVSLLDSVGLPTADVRDGRATFYLAARAGADDPVAVGGLEPAGDAALLRSLAVAPGSRGAGVGSALVAELESRAAVEGVRDCYLLTTDAADFFAAHGYERVDRADAPPGVRGTRQFEALCPDSATVMRTRLPEPSP